MEKKITKFEVLEIIITITLIISFLGASMNTIVRETNGDKMPVSLKEYQEIHETSITYLETSRHFTYVEKSEIKFWQLSDIFPYNLGIISGVASVGDIVMFFGSMILIVCALIFFLIYDKTQPEEV